MAKRRNQGGKRGDDKPRRSDPRESDARESDSRDADKRQSEKRASDEPSRGKQRREALRLERAAGGQRIFADPPTPVEEPAFWFGFEITWIKLVLGRFVFFG